MTELIVDMLAIIGLLAIVLAVLLFLADDPPPMPPASRQIEPDVLRAQRRIHDLASLSAQLMVAESRKHRRDLK